MNNQKFEVGQRVIVHSGANIGGYDGREGIIKHAYQPMSGFPHLLVSFKDGANIHVYGQKDKKFNVEIIKDNKMKEIPVTKENAKVGMKVRLLSNQYGFEKDDIGTIEKIDYDGVDILVSGRVSTSAIKPYVYVTYDMIVIAEINPKKFCVTGGSQTLKDAFQKELETLGFKYRGSGKWIALYPRSEYWTLDNKNRRDYCYDHGDEQRIIYNLPEDYNTALEAFKEVLNWKDIDDSIVKDIKLDLRQGKDKWRATIGKSGISLQHQSDSSNIFLRGDDIQKMLTNLKTLNSLNIIGPGEWAIKVKEISIGCQEGFNVEDLTIICNTWSSLQ